MNLFCTFYRSRLSRIVTLKQPIPESSALQGHLSGCPACQSFYTEMQGLSHRLAEGTGVQSSDKGVEEALIARLNSLPASTRFPGRMALNTSALVLGSLALVFLVSRLLFNSQPHDLGPAPVVKEVARNSPGRSIEGRNFEPVETSELDLAPPIEEPGIRANVSQVTRPRHRMRVRRPLNSVKRVLRPRQLSIEETAYAKSFIAQRLSLCAALLEKSNEPQLAEDAYKTAYRFQPTTELAYLVGRSSEENGNNAQALAFYATALKQNQDETAENSNSQNQQNATKDNSKE